MNGVGWDLGICFLPADPEKHMGVGGDGGGGTQGLAQPAVSSTLVHLHGYLQRERGNGKNKAGNKDYTLYMCSGVARWVECLAL